MLAHCSVGMEVSLGDKKMRQIFLGKIVGGLAKRRLLSGKPIGKNMPTDKAYVVQDDRDLDFERRSSPDSLTGFKPAARRDARRVHIVSLAR